MDLYAKERFEIEMSRAVAGFQQAQLALLHAEQVAPVHNRQTAENWRLVRASTRSALTLACVITMAVAADELRDHNPTEIVPDTSGGDLQ